MRIPTNIADVVATDCVDGEVRSNLGDSTDGTGIDSDVPHWGTDGFASRPNDPDDDGSAQALYLVDGQEKRVIGTRDNRWATLAGNLAPGDRAIVTNCPARVFLKRNNSAVTLYTEGSEGKPILIEANGSKDNISIVVCGDDGNAVIQAKPGSIMLGVDGGGSLVIDKQGVHVFGPHFAANTGGGNLGVIAGLPPPVPANSICYGPVGQTAVGSTTWTVAI